MKHMTEVPTSLLKAIQTDRRQNIEKVLKSYTKFCTLPVRPARMRVLEPNGETTLKQTIVPATSIFLKPNAFLDENHIDRDAITYFVAETAMAFPIAHVYQGSGHVCLGSIFVPSKVSKYNPQQPLETLFLHNDRVLSHGNASLKLSKEKVKKVNQILNAADVYLPRDLKENLKTNYELLKDDNIWQIAAKVYKQKTLTEALEIMTIVYNGIFKEERITDGC